MAAYDQVTIDGDLAAEVRKILEERPGLWSSRRALYHDLIRRGIVSVSGGPVAPIVVQAPTPPPPPDPLSDSKYAILPRPSQPPAPAPPAVTQDAAPDDEVGSSRGSRGRPPRRSDLDDVTSGGKAAAAPPLARDTAKAEAVGPPTRIDAEISTWTCPTCGATIPLDERAGHKEVHAREGGRERDAADKRGTATEARATTVGAAANPAPARKTPDLDRLASQVLESTKAGLPRLLDPADSKTYLVALVRHSLEVQGVADEDLPADDVALTFLAKLAERSTVIARALKVTA